MRESTRIPDRRGDFHDMIARRYRLRRSVEKTWPDFSRLVTGKLPAFVYGGGPSTLPVFCYHSIDERFETDLRHLSESGYRTLGAAEIGAFGNREWQPDSKCVVLTFDDGDSSLGRVGVPLLARYGFRAIAFVVPGLVPASSDEDLVGWDLLREAVHRGVLDVGSHSLYHHHVPVAPRVIGVVDQRTDTAFRANIPIPRLDGGDKPKLGQPILRGRPLYTALRAFEPDPGAIERFANAARERTGGFSSEDAARPIALGSLPPITGRPIDTKGCEDAIVSDMSESIAIIERRCPNPAARHLCYPWFAGRKSTDRMAKQAGVEVVYKGVTANDHTPRTDTSPASFSRLPEDLLRRLPGPDQVTLTSLVGARIRRLANRGGT